jgi:hypothetical protein
MKHLPGAETRHRQDLGIFATRLVGVQPCQEPDDERRMLALVVSTAQRLERMELAPKIAVAEAVE